MTTREPASDSANTTGVPQDPLDELPALLARVTESHRLLREAEQATTNARNEFRLALTLAHGGGASLAFLGRLVGLSRQTIATNIVEAIAEAERSGEIPPKAEPPLDPAKMVQAEDLGFRLGSVKRKKS